MTPRRTDRGGRRRWPLLLAATLTLATSAVITGARAATLSHTPVGKLETVVQSGTGIAIRGWAIDPDTLLAIHVDVYLDGHGTRLTANTYRPDVGQAHPGYGTHHGFSAQFPAAAGRHTLCAYAIDYGLGSTNPLLGCRTLTLNYDPFGEISTVTQFPGGFTTTGFAIDHDQPRPALAVRLSVDGTLTAATANLSRPDVAARYPWAGAAHGFSITAHAAEGAHRVCVLATNIGLGQDRTVACRTVTLNFSPVGAITSLKQVPGGFRVRGWAVDPDTSGTISVTVWADGLQVGTTTAKLASSVHNGHGYDAAFQMGTGLIPPGSHSICVHGVNAGTFGRNRTLACLNITLNFNPSAAITGLKRQSPGYQVTGWVRDPDTAAAIYVVIKTDGKNTAYVLANKTGVSHSGHNFVITVPASNGSHAVCAYGINVNYGSGNSAAACARITLNFNPIGAFEKVTRVTGSNDIVVTGWAIDPDTTKPSSIRVSIDGRVVGTPTAGVSRPDVAERHPDFGPLHGLAARFGATAGEHKVCATAVNILGGTGDTKLGCRIINAVHPVVPSAPTAVAASAGFGGATVTWSAPTSDGGAPWTSYTVTSSPGARSVTVRASTRAATVTGLAASTRYTFAVVATNVAGRSAAGRSPAVVTDASPPPQTSPAPISTSRYIRNISGSSSTDLSKMRAEGAADARANPSGHGYLILLDIGGQDQADHGVLLSATTRFVSYGDLVRDIDAYVDGYHSLQKPSAPVTIAIGTNNDMDVSSSSGATWARTVVNPVLAYAARYVGMRIAGANDIEPGFRGTYTQSKAWLAGYLGATSARFVFNGSADGCAWTVINRGCNNGWTMAGLYYLSAGIAPIRIVNLPQIYNNTMAAQWKYISLTGIATQRPRINFGGVLTEFTACAQAGGCGSLTGNSAWTQMWNQLQSHPALRIGSLPYSTDLRIDR